MRALCFGWGLRLTGSDGILWRWRHGFTEGGRWVTAVGEAGERSKIANERKLF